MLAGDVNREVLLVINNYTGDRLNFGLAVEMARNVHNYRNVKLLIVDDDCSIDSPRQSTGRRGLAGIQLVIKIAGAMSEAGASLDDIHEYCEAILRDRLIRTIGFSFHHDKLNNLSDIEIGYGIHGEPGSMKIEKEISFAPVIRIIAAKLRLNEVKADVMVLFNNLGGASQFIFYQFVREFLEITKSFDSFRIVKAYAGAFLTSLSKEALSVTVMELRDEKILEYLDHPVSAVSGHLFTSPLTVEIPNIVEFHIPRIAQKATTEARVSREEKDTTSRAIRGACKAAIDAKHYLNEVDSELGDGDTGSTLSRGAEALLRCLDEEKLALNNPLEMLQQISTILLDSMGGTSGAIFSIFFQCASKAFIVENVHSYKCWTNALSSGINGIMQHGKSEVGDRTLLDALHAGSRGMNEQMKINDRNGSKDLLKAFAEGCRHGSESTKCLSPKSGRSAYSFSDKDSNFVFESQNPDPGAHAVDIISNAIFKAFAGSS